MPNSKFSKISSIIQDAKKGKMFILVDDKNRENEGDLIIPGSKCNSKSINFMAKHGRGLICLALTKKQIDNLKLPLMSPNNKSRMQTAFTISIEAKRGITTGISAQDRSKTIKTAINPKVKKKRYCFSRTCFSFSSQKWRCSRKGWTHRGICRYFKVIQSKSQLSYL